MVGTIKITLGESTNSATSRVSAFYTQVKAALKSIIELAQVTGRCRRTLDIDGQKVTVALRSRGGSITGHLVWEEYNQEEPLDVILDCDENELSQAALQVMDSYYEVTDRTPPGWK